MAHVSENGRKGQILTPYPSNPFTVPKCKFARRAIVRTANSANSHCEFSEFARRRSTAAAPRRRSPPTFLARCVHRLPACAHYFALLVHGLRTAGRVYGSLLAATTHVGTLPNCRDRAWCAGNQGCCRHGGGRDGWWRRRCGANTGRAPSATGLSRLITV